MKYKIYKFSFCTGLHIGNGHLTDAEYTIMADTVFSALCQEALKMGGVEQLNQLIDYVRNGKIRLSDGFPYMQNDCFYVPRPMLMVKREKKGNSNEKKAFKKLKYIPVEQLDSYLKGMMDPTEEVDRIKQLGSYSIKDQAAVRGLDEAMPYSVGGYYFNKDNGIYICVGYTEESEELLEELLLSLSYSGIGGKLSSGMGKFVLYSVPLPHSMEKHLNTEQFSTWMSISVSLPRDDELELVLPDSSYGVIKRSGFISSTTFADTQRKKRDLYLLQSGSCFAKKYSGDVYDVSGEGNHPVYRYAVPMFMGVEWYE